MKGIIITSSEEHSGKSVFAVGTAAVLKDRGLSVGYMKPVGNYPIKIGNRYVDEDAFFAKEVLGLKDPIDDMSPFILTWETKNKYLSGKTAETQKKVKECYGRISGGKDIVLIESARNFLNGKMLGLSALELGRILEAGILLLDIYNDDLSVDRALAARDYFEGNLLGIAWNFVPTARKQYIQDNLEEYFQAENIGFFGAIYADKILRSISVSDLAIGIGGEVICADDKRDELVESMMIGAMNQEHSLQLFRKQQNKVVVTGGDRSDVQIAALETSTKALVLTGGERPSPIVLGKAAEIGVPIIIVDTDTATTVGLVEEAIGRQHLHGEKKIEAVKKLIEENIDIDALLKEAGVDNR